MPIDGGNTDRHSCGVFNLQTFSMIAFDLTVIRDVCGPDACVEMMTLRRVRGPRSAGPGSRAAVCRAVSFPRHCCCVGTFRCSFGDPDFVVL